MSDRQANLEQTLTSVIGLLETEQALKKVCPPYCFRSWECVDGMGMRREQREGGRVDVNVDMKEQVAEVWLLMR